MSGSAGGSRRRVGALTVAALAVIGIGALTMAMLVLNGNSTADPIGANDYIEYWAAFEIASEGGDAYDPALMAEKQNEVGLAAHQNAPLLFWNPPWVLLIMAPVLLLPFEVGNAVWLALNVALALGVGWASWDLFGPRGRPIPAAALAGSLLFLPFLESTRIGQLGVVMAAAVLGFLLALRRDRTVLAGMLLAAWTFKPQSVLLVALVVALHLFTRQHWKLLAVTFATIASLYGSSAVLFPATTASWTPVQGPTEWRTASLAGWLRIIVGDEPTWPLVVVPLVGLLAVLPWALRHRRQLPWQAVPAIIALSLLFAPHGWIFDAVVLMPVHTVLIGLAASGQREAWPWVAAVSAAQLLALWFRNLEWTTHEHLVWLPAALGAIWILWLQRSRPAVHGSIDSYSGVTA